MKTSSTIPLHDERLQVKKIAAVGFILAVLMGCSSKPGAADIEAPLMADLNQCSLWTVSDVKKVDGVPSGANYRVDFSAKLTMNATPQEAMRTYMEHQTDPNFIGCHVFIASLANRQTGTLWKQYDVTGAGVFVKSEKGWQLVGELGEYAFAPIGGPGQPLPIAVAPVAAPAPMPTVAAASIVSPVEPEPQQAPMSPCVAAKMTAYDKNRDKEIEEMSKAAQANGEEVQTSAGMDELMRQEAFDKAAADCK